MWLCEQWNSTQPQKVVKSCHLQQHGCTRKALCYDLNYIWNLKETKNKLQPPLNKLKKTQNQADRKRAEICGYQRWGVEVEESGQNVQASSYKKNKD